MRDLFNFDTYSAGAIAACAALTLAALALPAHAGQTPRTVLNEAVTFAETMLLNDAISGEEYMFLVCSAMESAVTDGLSATSAMDAGGVGDCKGTIVDQEAAAALVTSVEQTTQSTEEAGQTSAPASSIVIPQTTASANDSTSPTTN